MYTGAEYQAVMRDALARKLIELFRNPDALRRFIAKMEREHPRIAQKLVIMAKRHAGRRAGGI